MSFLAKLEFNDSEIVFNVLECSFEFNVSTDKRGRAAEAMHGGRINVLLESTEEEDFLLWIMQREHKSGTITFVRRDAMASTKKITFTRALCSHYAEEFNSSGSVPMRTDLIIVPEKIDIEGTVFELRNS
jgi:Hemolysin coregulated protein Hcp (TssD)